MPAAEDDETRPAGERTSLLPWSAVDNIPRLEVTPAPAWQLDEIDEDEDARHRYLAELRSNMRVSRPGRRERRNAINPIRPSLLGALEFRSVLNSLEKKATTATRGAIHLRRYSDDSYARTSGGVSALSEPDLLTQATEVTRRRNTMFPSRSYMPRGRAASANYVTGLKLDTTFLRIPEAIPETAVASSGPTPAEGPWDTPIVQFSPPEFGSARSSRLGAPPSPKLLISPASSAGPSRTPSPGSSPARSHGLLESPSFQSPTHEHRPAPSPRLSPRMRPTSKVPLLQLPDSDQTRPLLSGSPIMTQSPGLLSPVIPFPSVQLPGPVLAPDSVTDFPPLEEVDADEGNHFEELPQHKWWPYSYLPPPEVIIATLFPTLYAWRSKSLWEKFLGIAMAPSVFLLTSTLPIVESGGAEEDPEVEPRPAGLEDSRSVMQAQPSSDTTNTSARRGGDSAPPDSHNTAMAHVGPNGKAPDNEEVALPSDAKDWNRWLVIFQLFTAPLFVVLIVWANLDEGHGTKTLVLLVLSSLAFSLVCLVILLALTSADREPKYRPLLCFLGFAVAVAWISTIANEVVGVLKAFGVILGMSDAILGLTIFAVGNSMGDLVADITVARLGYPVMALSACFGGPMLNILLGIGISGMYMTIKRGTQKQAEHPDRRVTYQPFEIEVSMTLVISGITLLVTLVGLLIVVPLNGWRMDRKIGIGLVALWTLSTIGNVVIEVMGVGEARPSFLRFDGD